MARLGSRSVCVSRGQINFNPADELLQCTETGCYYLETNQHLLILPFYYKPFDSVPHQRLLLKSKGYGFEGGPQEWFRNFLTNRQQHVFVCSTYSSQSPIQNTSGNNFRATLLFLTYFFVCFFFVFYFILFYIFICICIVKSCLFSHVC